MKTAVEYPVCRCGFDFHEDDRDRWYNAMKATLTKYYVSYQIECPECNHLMFIEAEFTGLTHA